MATSILTNRAPTCDQPTPSKLVNSYDLLSFGFVPETDDMVCLVRDRATGKIKPALGSNLLAVSYGKDAYLLEMMQEDASLLDIFKGGR